MEIVEVLVRTISEDEGSISLATGGVWEAVANRASRPPFIIVNLVTGRTEYSHDKEAEIRTGLVDVKVVTQSNEFGTAEAIRDAFDVAIFALNTSHDNGVQTVVRAGEIRYPEFDGDVRYNHLGWTYSYMYWEP